MSTFPDVRITPTEAKQKFRDSQGNVIKAHGRDHALLLFVEFSNPTQARQWVGQLLAGIATGNDPARDTVRITSTEQQLSDRERRQLDDSDAGLFTGLLFSAAGLLALGLPAARLPAEGDQQAPGRDDAFAGGMRDAGLQKLLHDPAPAAWEPAWRLDAPAGPRTVHALLLLADDDLDGRLRPAATVIRNGLVAFGIRLSVEEQGSRLTEGNIDIEHFGYADGVSQPLYLTDDNPAAQAHHRDKALRAEDAVFVPDTLSGQAEAWGSFMVFRKLEQAVAAFKKEEIALGGPKTPARPDALALADPELAGAMLVGRFENGTPLAVQGTDAAGAFTNDFDFSQDTEGLRCPFHAHIRKMNPRGETNADPQELRHRITRRGIPYGARPADELVDDGQRRGLLFMCYQRSIGQQFEFMQRSWANNASFLRPAVAAGPATGLDPIIGQGDRADKLTFPLEWRPAPDNGAPTAIAGFGQHVTLRGGEYLYAPSMSGLQALADGFPSA
jgi:Dyp-type peroxidase family